jgi:hypothetical protein
LTYSEVIYIGNGVGSILRKLNLCDERLALLMKNKRFLQFIFLSFVDYSSLVGYYGNLSAVSDKYKIPLKSDQKLFFGAILSLKNLLSNKVIESNGYHSLKKDSLHPILISRLASMEIAFRIQKAVSYDDVLLDIHTRMQSSKSNKMDFLYELKTVSLILADFDLMEWIGSVENSSVDEEYQVSHNQYLQIVNLIRAVKNQNEEKIDNLIERIDRSKWVLSYHDFYTIFTLIGKYHATHNNIKRKKIREQYCTLATELKYPFFSDSYLTNYFDS